MWFSLSVSISLDGGERQAGDCHVGSKGGCRPRNVTGLSDASRAYELSASASVFSFCYH